MHDIPFLVADSEATKKHQNGSGAGPGEDEEAVTDSEAGSGWIACTTDSILAMKDTLWDMLITMPPPYSAGAREKVWPTVECPRGGTPVKASQRDLRRFLALRAGLARLSTAAAAAPTPAPDPDSPRSETSNTNTANTNTFRLSTGLSAALVPAEEPQDAMDKVVQPLSWTALAYNGFMWWASAGEQSRTEEVDETSRDAALLADLIPPMRTPSMTMPTPTTRTTALPFLADSVSSLTAKGADATDDEARTELAIIAYFHRLTTQMLSVMADVVDSTDDSYDDEDELDNSDHDGVEDVLLRPGEEQLDPRSVLISSHAVESMGLDVWNSEDAEFVKELMVKYFGRQACIEGKGVEVCGVRVC